MYWSTPRAPPIQALLALRPSIALMLPATVKLLPIARIPAVQIPADALRLTIIVHYCQNIPARY